MEHASTPAPNPETIQCGCGRKYSTEEWNRLEYVGLQDDQDGGWLELRNCQCRSTLAIEVKP